MKFSELDDVRVKLDEPGRKEFWHRVDEFGGVKTFSDAFEVSSSKIYNWKSKDSFIPIELVKKVFGNEASQYVEAYKGPGRSKAVKNPVFPIPEDNELLTRIQCSVTTNENGIPLYQASDSGLAERFADLLQGIGDVPFKIYERDIFELRYPKYLHGLFHQMSYEENIDALVDEEGEFEQNKIILNGKEINPKRLKNLHHRDKRLKLALTRKDHEQIAKLINEEKKRVKRLVNN